MCVVSKVVIESYEPKLNEIYTTLKTNMSVINLKFDLLHHTDHVNESVKGRLYS